MTETYDLAIVGASFAGLVAAKVAAERGLHLRLNLRVGAERRHEAGNPDHGQRVEHVAADDVA